MPKNVAILDHRADSLKPSRKASTFSIALLLHLTLSAWTIRRTETWYYLADAKKDSSADDYLQSITSIKLPTAETPHNLGTLVMFDEELLKPYGKMGLNKTAKGEFDEDGVGGIGSRRSETWIECGKTAERGGGVCQSR